MAEIQEPDSGEEAGHTGAAEGTRMLVGRIWPRGLTKSRVELSEWCQQVALSTALGKWYDHDQSASRSSASAIVPSLRTPSGRRRCST